LAPAAKVLLQIWETLQAVETNRQQCLRLTERCAEILLSVREEVKEAGEEVGEELKLPVEKLTDKRLGAYLLLFRTLVPLPSLSLLFPSLPSPSQTQSNNFPQKTEPSPRSNPSSSNKSTDPSSNDTSNERRSKTK
ncbi:hypothetical protein H0H93_011203, partial [Arthromyces matolae]